MYYPVSVLNGNAGSFVQHRNKILNVGYVSSPALSLSALVCIFLWSTYASYWSDRCSPQQSQSLHRRQKEEGRESGKTDERQGKIGERREEWWWVTEWERMRGRGRKEKACGEVGWWVWGRKKWGGRRRGRGGWEGGRKILWMLTTVPLHKSAH